MLSLSVFLCSGMVLFMADASGADSPAPPELAAKEDASPPPFTPNYDENLVPTYELPEPLERADGTRIRTASDWPSRRDEILDLFRRHVYGRVPGRPETLRFESLEVDPHAMGDDATLKRIAIHSEQGGRSHSFELVLFLPNDAARPTPVFLLMNNRGYGNTDPTRQKKSPFWPAEAVVARGYGVAAFQVRDVAPDHPERWREGVAELFKDGESAPDGWGALAAWAWGASRVLDYFETDDAVDATRVAVVGHSRGGKAALWAAAADERFAMAVSNNSGCGGAALSRRRFGETVARINSQFPHWFCPNFHDYGDREDALPVDQHMLIGLIAPRPVYVASAAEDLWADPRGEFLALAHASSVYALWGEPAVGPDDMPAPDQPLIVGRRGYHIRSGGHNLTPYDWNRFMDLADRVWSATDGEGPGDPDR